MVGLIISDKIHTTKFFIQFDAHIISSLAYGEICKFILEPVWHDPLATVWIMNILSGLSTRSPVFLGSGGTLC